MLLVVAEDPETAEAAAPSVDDAPQVSAPSIAVATAHTRNGPLVLHTFRALRHRNFRVFWSGQLISLTGTWMQNVAQGWLVYQLTHSPLWLGIVGFASALPVLLFTLVGGVAADHFSKRRILLVTQGVAMFQALLLALLTALGLVQVWHVIVLAFLLGVVHAFDTPTRQAFVIELVGRVDLMNAIALNSSAFNSTRIIGPAIAGVILGGLSAAAKEWWGIGSALRAEMIGIAACFFLNGLSYLGTIAGLLLLRLGAFSPADRASSVWKRIREGVSYVRHNSSALALLSLIGVSSVFGFSYMTLMPVFAGKVLNVGASGLGFLMAATGVGALGGALFLASTADFRRKGLLLTAGNFFFPLMLLLFSLSRVFPLSLLSLAGVGWGLLTQNALTNTLLQTMVPDRLRGRVISLYTLMFLGMMPLGSLQAGAIAQAVGAPGAVQIGATLCLAFALAVYWKLPQVRLLQ